ncbi:N-6 DNA methylase [Candidatus Bathyarchaeota archaeon]|nr:N-6 DNA methylase [Candidatus Bathyarchaeota archaeon]
MAPNEVKQPSQRRLSPEDEDLAKELKRLGYADRIIKIVVSEKDKPEGKVRLQWMRKLVKEYCFPASHIDIEVPAGVGRDAGKRNVPVRADIVVYRDENKAKPLAVIETKAPKEKEGVAQAESYARNLGAEYHLWSNGLYERAFKTSTYPNQSDPIARLPVWVEDKPLPQKVPKTETLRPFKDEEELRQVISFCHLLILEKLGHDPAKAFDEMTKLLFIKLYDEREVPSYYEFVVLAKETPHEVADRVRQLFDKAMSSSKYQDVFWSQFNTEPVPVTLELDDFSIFNIVQVLQGYSLVNTTENIQGADIKGTVYEQMVGNTFRGELAQFFTPREIVEFMVEIIRPDRESKILDPACGSGGFLIMTLRKLREWIKQENPNLSETEIKASIKYFAEHKTFGIDINDRMVRVAKMNMIMHGDGHSGIFHILRGGGLLTDPNLPSKLQEELKDGTVKIVFSNPPFAGREKDPKILEKFELGKNKKGNPVSVSKELLFVEKIIALLQYGGKAGLVLPAGIFNNPSRVYKKCREMIKENTKILALIGLPHPAFRASGANNEGNLLFLQKIKELPTDYDIYIDWARYVGFDSTGRKLPLNDLPEILKRTKNPNPENIISFSELEDRIDPWHYHPKYKEIEMSLSKSQYPLRPISKLVEKSKDKFDPKANLNTVFNYIEVNDVDLVKGEIISSKQIMGKTAPNRATYVLKEGDFLIPNAMHCIRGVCIVPKEYEGCIATNRFFVVRPKIEIVNPVYLYYMLKQPTIFYLLKRQATGEINPGISYGALEKVKIPVPEKMEDQNKIAEQIKVEERKKAELLKQISKHEQAILSLVGSIVPSIKTEKQEISKEGYEYIADV